MPKALAIIGLVALIACGYLSINHYVNLKSSLDDAYITYRVAHNLASGCGPYYNPAEKVQASSAPLYMIVLALLHKMTALEITVISEIIEVLCILAIALLLFLLGRQQRLGWGALVAPVIFLSQPDLLIYVKGMETLLYVSLILALIFFEMRKWHCLVGLALGLLAATRLDGAAFALAYLAYWFLGRALLGKPSFNYKKLLASLACGVAAGLPFLCFVLYYYGSPLAASVKGKVLYHYPFTYSGDLLAYFLGINRFDYEPWVLDIKTLFPGTPYPTIWGWIALGLLALQLRRPMPLPVFYERLGLCAAFLLTHALIFILSGAPGFIWYSFPVKVLSIPIISYLLVTLACDAFKGPSLAMAAGRPWRLARGAFLSLAVAFFVYTRVILYVYYGNLFSHGPTEQIYGERFLPLASAAQWLDRKVGNKRWVLATSEIGLMGYECRLPILDLFGLASPQIHPFLADRRELRMVLRFRPELYVTCNADEFDPRHPRYNQALAREFERSYRLLRQMSSGAEGLRIYLRRDLLWPGAATGSL